MGHVGLNAEYKRLWGRSHHCVVLYFKEIWPRNETDFETFLFPTTSLFEAFRDNFLADQNVVILVGGDVAFHFRDETVTGLFLWNVNLIYINIKAELRLNRACQYSYQGWCLMG